MSNSLRRHESQHANLPVHHQLPEFKHTNLARIEGIKVQPSKVLYACRGFDITAEVELNGKQFSCVHIYELNEGSDFALEKSGVSFQDESGEWQTEYTQSGTIVDMMKVLRRLAGITD